VTTRFFLVSSTETGVGSGVFSTTLSTIDVVS